MRGDPSLTRAKVALEKMTKAWGEIDQGFLVECRDLEGYIDPGDIHITTTTANDQPEELYALLSEFSKLFVLPTELPPVREVDNRLILWKEHKVIVRPCRYAHHQKNEIEKMIDDMLQVGTIQPSGSPYSNPMLLVRKKDGGR